MERNFDLDQFLKDIAEEQLFKSISPKHQALEEIRLRELSEFSNSYVPVYSENGERHNPIVPEFIEEPESRAMKKPVDENGYPFVSQSDAARILEIDRNAAIFLGSGTIRIEREKVPGSAKSSRVWIRLIDLRIHLETRDTIKAAKIEKCLADIDKYRALATQNGFKLRFLGSDYDRPDFYPNLSKRK